MNRFVRSLRLFALSTSAFLVGLMNYVVFRSWMGVDEQIISAMKYGEGPYEFVILNIIIITLLWFIYTELKEEFKWQ